MVDDETDKTLPGLIGRERERTELSALLATSRVVLVYGAAGVGKTALVLEVCRAGVLDGTLPPLVHVSLAGVGDPREAVERTARAMAEPRPTPGPERVAAALTSLLAASPRTVVWDDLDERAASLGDILRRFSASSTMEVAEGRGAPSRIIGVSRRFISAREAKVRAAVYEVNALSHDDAVRLVRAVEAERGRTLADDLVEATGGNPLLLRIALAQPALPRVANDANDAIRASIERHASGSARKILTLLAAAECPLDEAELVRVAGGAAREALNELRKSLLVVREGARVGLAQPVRTVVEGDLGEPDTATWKTLARMAQKALAASAHDDAALVLLGRALLELGDVERALAAVREHAVARAAAPTAAVERLLRQIAARAPASSATALRLLARELLRAGDYDSARRALDELPKPRTREEAERVALLRAESHIRAGEPEAAQRALDALSRPEKSGAAGAKKRGAAGAREREREPDGTEESVGVVLTRAELAILRGELAEVRATLEALAERTADVPQLEARRAVEIAASHIYEERFDLTHAWTARARAAQRAAGLPVERVVTILDVHALFGLGEVDRAEELIARETRGGADADILAISALVCRGEYTRALAVGDAAIAALDRHADLIFRSVLARDLARAAIGAGQYARAERMLRLAEAAGDEPGLAALRPICDAERARLAEAEGDIARARRFMDRAYERIPASPFVTIDRELLAGRPPRGARSSPGLPVARAYASLRAAELALATGALDDALAAADAAERYYATARLWHETARARRARAEALARLSADQGRGDRERQDLAERAEQALAACDELALPHGYVPLLVVSALVRAALSESLGDLRGAAHALGAALRAAGEGRDASLARAAARLGVAAREPRGEAAARRPYAAVIDRLGLARDADVVWRIGDRTFLRAADDEPPQPVSCVLEVDERVVRAGGRALEMPEQRLALLGALAEAGDAGATLEEIFARVWGGAFHPLRHRNAVYVALARLKESLKPVARDVRVTHDGERYRLGGALPVGVRRKASGAGVREAIGAELDDPG